MAPSAYNPFAMAKCGNRFGYHLRNWKEHVAWWNYQPLPIRWWLMQIVIFPRSTAITTCGPRAVVNLSGNLGRATICQTSETIIGCRRWDGINTIAWCWVSCCTTRVCLRRSFGILWCQCIRLDGRICRVWETLAITPWVESDTRVCGLGWVRWRFRVTYRGGIRLATIRWCIRDLL